MGTQCQSGAEAVERWWRLWEVLGLWGRGKDRINTHTTSVVRTIIIEVPDRPSWVDYIHLWQITPNYEPGKVYLQPGVTVSNRIRISEEEADVLKALLLGD